MTKITFTVLAFFTIAFASAQEDTLAAHYEKIEKSLKYETGKIDIPAGNATLTVPKGFMYLDGKQTQYVLKDLWGNPDNEAILGALVPKNGGVTYSDSWMFVLQYEDMGYVSDDDAADTNYDELLTEMQDDVATANEERKTMGFENVSLIGWASKPYYDRQLKVLHWAKELKFASSEVNTLNYDLRVLGRKGVFRISAVSNIDQLPAVKKSIPGILQSVKFNEDFAYADFDSNTDEVAAWTIGGLVAGKVLAKVGFFAILAKFGKFIFIGLIAAFAAAKKFIFNKKEQVTSNPALAEASDESTLDEEK